MRKVIFLVLLIVCCGTNLNFAQDGRVTDPERFSLPAEENFQDTTGIVTTRMEASCQPLEKKLIQVNPGCNDLYLNKGSKYGTTPTYPIYNNDGTIWFELVWARPADVSFRLSKEIGFEPYRYSGYEGSALRITGESENWYRVEVNEKTHEIKYAPKDNNTWEKVNWEFFILETIQIWACSPVRLLDHPDGEMIKEIIFNDPNPMDLYVSEVEGDWLKVRYGRVQDKDKNGWIRWRKGRETLVGNLARPRDYIRVSTCEK